MAYERVQWKDHIVQRPRTYTMVKNEDGSITLTPEPGEVIQHGMALNARNLGRSEEALTYCCAALDMLSCLVDSMYMEMETMHQQLSALAGVEDT